jgi:hypothetical protein
VTSCEPVSFSRTPLHGGSKLVGWMVSLCVQAVPGSGGLVSCLSQRMPGFDPSSVHVTFAAHQVAVGQVFLRVLCILSVIIII